MANLWQKLVGEAQKLVIGQENSFRLAMTCFLAGGHLLLEDEPGVGKTTFAKTFAKILGLDFGRIQFTSDLLPADIIGVSIFHRETEDFQFKAGPLFHHLVLGDELNRASPKTQSAFLQAMEEASVSVDGKTMTLQQPFFFIATQNPRKSIGTFALPESQLDRFMMKLSLGYPNADAEYRILHFDSSSELRQEIQTLWTLADINEMRHQSRRIHCSEAILRYIVAIAQESRKLEQGLSPRASLALKHASQAYAYTDGRDFVIPEDVQAIALAVINHRLIRGDEWQVERGRERAQKLIQSLSVPL